MLRLRTITIPLLLFAAGNAVPADAPATARPEDLLGFLNHTIIWYRQLGSLQQVVNEPSEMVFLNDTRQIADQVVKLSFDFARTEAQTLAAQKGANSTETQEAASPERQNLQSRAEKSQQAVSQVENQLESLKQQLNTAPARKRKLLEANIAELQDELELLKARQDTLQNMLQFATGMTARAGSKGLPAQIEELARTIPAAAAETKPAAAGATSAPADTTSLLTTATANDHKTESSSLFGRIAEVFEYRRKLQLLDASLRLTDSLTGSSKTVRTPLVAQLKDLTQRSDQLANQPASQDTSALDQQRKELQGLTAQYKQLSAAILPLGKQTILLDVYKRNLLNWQTVVQGQYSDRLKSVLLRLGTTLGIILVIVAGSEIWRRMTFHYVQDSRRRHQFLILRRVIVVPLLLIVLIATFVSGLGSITLFAGLSTAGLAVALQNLLQAVVGYFVLIGKFGVRVGDRIQVAGVTGEVIDIGLVRLHLVEMNSGGGSQTTGRVVAFSNAVVFQPDAGFFKQIPGTNFVWHEVSLTLPPDTDYRQLEERMLQAVKRIFSDYKDKMEVQRRTMEHAVHGLTVQPLHPESRLYLTPTGTQVAVRYPVEVDDATDVDDRITRAVLDATGREPKVADASALEDTGEASEAAAQKR